MLQNATRSEQQNAIDRLVAGDTDEQAAKAAGFAESTEKKSKCKNAKVKAGKLSFSLFVSFASFCSMLLSVRGLLGFGKQRHDLSPGELAFWREILAQGGA
jgi:hypothetical protein